MSRKPHEPQLNRTALQFSSAYITKYAVTIQTLNSKSGKVKTGLVYISITKNHNDGTQITDLDEREETRTKELG